MPLVYGYLTAFTGRPMVARDSRHLPPEVVLVDWEQVEGGPSGNGKHRENGKAKDGRTLFE